MSVPFRIGVLQLSMEPLQQTVRMAQACDRAGFDIFWLAEAYPWWRKHGMEARSSTAMTAVIATQTKNIVIGWGIISPYTRHPVQIAMEARVMQDAAGDGRFLLGLGASKIFMKEIGEGEKGKDVGPAVVMRESIEIIQAMLAGGAVEYHGKAFDASAPALKNDAHVSRARVPIYVGATGPVLQRLAGSHSDGLLTASITTPDFVRYARGNMEEGAKQGRQGPGGARSGRGHRGQHQPRFEEGQRRRARDGGHVSRQQGAEHSRLGRRAAAESRADALRRLRPSPTPWKRAGAKPRHRAVTDEVLKKACPIAGTPDECCERIEEYRQAGCTNIMLEIWGDDREEQAQLFGEAVLPQFKGRVGKS